MSNSPASAGQALRPSVDGVGDLSGFQTRESEQITLGKHTVVVYGRIGPNACTAEKAHAFHCDIAALGTVPLDPSVVLDCLSHRLHCGAVVDGSKFDWLSRFQDNWYNWTNLTIVSFHDSSGERINDAAITADPAILKPVQDGDPADCRPADVRFV